MKQREPEPEFVEQEPKKRHPVIRAIGGVTLVGVLAGGGYVVHEYETLKGTDDTPTWMFPPAKIPPAVSQSGPIMFCAANTVDCDTSTALSYSPGLEYDPVTKNDVKKTMNQATVAIEDRTFLNHNGVSWHGVLRAFKNNAEGFSPIKGIKVSVASKSLSIGAFFPGTLQGASTLEMQENSVHNMREDPNAPLQQRVLDKYNEARYAKQLDIDLGCERGNTQATDDCKQKVEVLYYNAVDYGRGHGLQAASKLYFGKKLLDLDITQEAMLAGMPKHPNDTNLVIVDKLGNPIPISDIQPHTHAADVVVSEMNELWQRTDEVVTNMQQEGYITEAQSNQSHAEMASYFKFSDGKLYDYADRQKVGGTLLHVDSPFIDAQPTAKGSNIKANNMCAMDAVTLARNEAAIQLGHALDPGSKVIMTLNTVDQKALCQAVKDDPTIMETPTLDTAAVSEQADGGIVGMIGSKQELDNPNYAVGTMQINGQQQGSGRDAGSTNKVYFLAYAYDHGWTPKTKLTFVKNLDVKSYDGFNDLHITTGNGCVQAHLPTPCVATPVQGMVRSANDLPGLAANQFGLKNILQSARNMGVPVKNLGDASNTLGVGASSPLTAATSLNGIANAGNSVNSHIIKEIINSNGTVEYNAATDPNLQKSIAVFTKKSSRETIQALEAVGQSKHVTVPNGPNSWGGKTGTADSRTDVWFNGVSLDNKRGSRTFSFWAGNPKGNIPITQIKNSSYLATGVVRRYLTATMTGGQTDVADVVNQHR